jgi:ribosome recycling factor
MDDSLIGAALDEAREKMGKALGHTQTEFASVRTGRATPSLVEKLKVEYYGSEVTLQQLAGFSVPDARLLVISPYDKGSLKAIEKAILHSDLGITPNNDGQVIRLAFPPLTEERRKELVKHVHRLAEDHKVGVREARRDALTLLKDLESEGSVPADDRRREEKRIQTLTDEHIKKIEEMQAAKEAEILQV